MIMFSRYRISIALALALSLLLVLPVFAGGWAVITLDKLPTGVVAGEPVTVGFTVLQHGRTPMTGLYPTIRATLYKDTEFTVNAKPEGEPGHYVATLNFPQEGEWRWFINAFTMDQLMPMLTVSAPLAAASQPVTKAESAAASVPWLAIIRALAVGGALIGVALMLRQRNRWAVALTVLSLGVGVASFMSGAAVPAVEAQSASSSSSESAVSQVEYGRQLFVAKGCITCHRNSRVENSSEYWTIEFTGATDLSKFSASPEVLFIRLKDPSAAKSDTQMPNLGLKKEEIEALITFINSK
jgi:cytochrome c2